MAKTIVTVDQGGTGAETLTDGGVLLGSGVGAVTATAVLADGEILVGDGTTDPVALDVGSSTAITTLGTVATGTWEGTTIAVDQGGTGSTTASAALTALGAAPSAFTQTGTGAVATTVDAKLKESVSVKDFGATGDGSTDDSAAIQAAIDAVAAAGGEVVVPAGDYKISTTINLARRVRITGLGRTNAGYAHDDTHVGARFITGVADTDMFNNASLDPAGKVQQVLFTDISFKSGSATGGILFNFNAVTTGVIENVSFFRCSFSQLTADKEIFLAPTAGDCFDIHFDKCRFFYADNTSTPMLNIKADTVNNIVISEFTCTKSDKDSNNGDYFLYLDRNSGGAVSNVNISDGILQQPMGGFSDIRAPNNVILQNLDVYDATVTCGQPMFNFAASTGGIQPDSVTLINVESHFGTDAQPDLNYETTQTNTYMVMVNCDFDKVDLGGSNRWATAIGESPATGSRIVDGHITQLRGQGLRSLQPDDVDTKSISFNADGAHMALTGSTSSAVAALTDASTVAIDLADANNFSLLTTSGIGATRALGTPSNITAGQSGCIVITSDAASRALTYTSAWHFEGGTDPALTTDSGGVDTLAYYCPTDAIVQAVLLKDLK